MDDEVRRTKEQFVSNLNGTTWQEVDSIQLMQPLCVILLSSFMAFIYQGRRVKSNDGGSIIKVLKFLSDFTLSVLPLLFALTIFSEYYAAFSQLIIVCVILLLAVTCTNYNNMSFKTIWNSSLVSNYLSWYRAYVNVLTAVCILAVDFKIYPRRLAKTETFGTGLMDIFVGAFIMCNSLVCKEARDASLEFSGWKAKLSSIKKVLMSSLPLTVLGVSRLIATKSSNYQGHVTEYGVHWNFFMTLAATRVMCTLLLSLLKPSKAVLLGVTFAVTYQYLLTHRLQDYILQSGGRATDFVSANREGIFSLFGYMSLYFVGVAIGRLIFQQKRSTVGSQVKLCALLLLLSASSLLAQQTAENYGIATSRRMANLPFILWTIHHSLLVIAAMLAVALFNRVIDLMFGVHVSIHTSGLLDAINYNGLLYFLLANLLTGAVNLLVNTLDRTMKESIAILILYLFTLNSSIYILYLCKVRSKFW